MKKSQIFAIRSEVCSEIESQLQWAVNAVVDAKQYLQNSEQFDAEYWSTELEKAQFKVKIYKELIDKIENIKAD